MEALDLIVTIDTAVAHLAGALGKEVWVAGNDLIGEIAGRTLPEDGVAVVEGLFAPTHPSPVGAARQLMPLADPFVDAAFHAADVAEAKRLEVQNGVLGEFPDAT